MLLLSNGADPMHKVSDSTIIVLNFVFISKLELLFDRSHQTTMEKV